MQVTEADIYIVICHDNKYYTYKLTDQPEWPSSKQDIVSWSQVIMIQTAHELSVR